jgi:iron complex outermembrane receptor protein
MDMFKCALLFAVSMAAATPFAAASAQPQPPDDTDEVEDQDQGKAKQLDAIRVTARRRDEPARHVPLAVTALNREELASRGINDLGGLGEAVPNLAAYPARSFNSALTAYIRGIGQFDPVWGVEPGVGIYIDDVYLARPQAALLDVLDVDRIEVLRGPQGTLYGKNTIGGAIKYVSRRPGPEFGGELSLTAGSYEQREGRAVLNLPFGDRLRTRAAVARLARGGYGHNLVTGEDVSDRDATVARIGVEWLASDDVDVRLAWDGYRDRSAVQGAKRLATNPLDPAQTPPDPGDFDVRNGTPNYDQLDAGGLSLTIDWNIGERFRLTSISAHRGSRSRGTNDFDTLPVAIMELTRRFEDREDTQEWQLHWASARTHAIAGVYLFDGEAAGAGYIGGLGFGLTRGRIDTRSAAAYLNLTQEFDHGIGLEAGLRHTVERKAARMFDQDFADGGFMTPLGPPNTDFRDAKTFGALSPRLGVSWKPNTALMLYAQGTRGFKGGSFNIRALQRQFPESVHPVDDESVTAWEIGAKGRWMDGRVGLDAAAFRNDYDGIQLSVATSYDSDGDGMRDQFFQDFRNAGSGIIDGVEAELFVRSRAHLEWRAHAGYLDARYTRFISADRDIAGSRHFANAPRWTAGASMIADIPLGRAGALLARVDASYRGRAYPTTDPGEALAQPGYALWNASLAWRSPRRDWEVALVGRNLGNTSYRVSGFSLPPYGVLAGYYGPPRTLSLTASCFF